MSSVTIKFKDGSKREFPHKTRPGGSYTNQVKYEGGAVIVVDAYYVKTAFPLCDVAEVIETPIRWE